MNTNKKLSLMALTLTAVLTLAACSDDKAEDAGEKVDSMISTAKDTAEDAGDKIKDVATDASDKVKDFATDAGNDIEDACEDVKKKMNAEDTDC